MAIVSKIKKIISENSKKRGNIYGENGLKHILDVTRFAKILAKKRGTDIELTEIAALFHDYATLLDKKFVEEHEIYSSKFAQEILSSFNYPQEKINIIKDAIYCHRGSKNREKKTLEAKCLADADAMAHFSNIPSLFYLAYITYKAKTVEEAKKFVRGKLERSWNKLSPDAKQIILKQYDAAKIILED